MEEDKKNPELFLRVFAVLGGLLLITVLVIIKSQVENFNWLWFISIIVVILIIAIGMFFSFKVKELLSKVKKKDEEEKHPDPITDEQAIELFKKKLVSPSFADYYVGHEWQKPISVGADGKQIVLVVKLSQTPYCKNPNQFMAINLNYPTKFPIYYNVQEKLNIAEIMRDVNKMAVNPIDEPATEERIERDLKDGKETVYKKRTPHKKTLKEEKPKVEDLE